MASVALAALLRAAAEDSGANTGEIGGYPDEIFENLSETEKERYECGICYMVVRLAKECRHGHVFCTSCILTWAVTNRAGSDRCPVCRSPGTYGKNKEIDNRLALKRVRCNTRDCIWRGLLANFKFHKASHEREQNVSNIPSLPALPPSPLLTLTPSPRESTILRSPVNSSRLSLSSPFNNSTSPRSPFSVSTSPRSPFNIPTPTRLSPDMRTDGNRQSPLADRQSPLAFYYDRRNSPRRPAPLLNAQIQAGRNRVKAALENFDRRLTQRKRNIDEFHRERESARQVQLEEVHELESRLDDVSANLTHLLDDMAYDNDRYRGYIRTSNAMLNQRSQRSPRSQLHQDE